MLKLVSLISGVDRLAGFYIDYKFYREHALRGTLAGNLFNVVLHNKHVLF